MLKLNSIVIKSIVHAICVMHRVADVKRAYACVEKKIKIYT